MFRINIFRTVAMKTRLLVSGIISVFAISGLAGLSLYSLWQSELALEHQIKMMHAVRSEMMANLKHDSIEAGVIYAMLIGPEGKPEKQAYIRDKANVDIEEFHASLNELKNMTLGDDITLALEKLLPRAELFTSHGREVLEVAFQDRSAAAAQFGAFQEDYEVLSEQLHPLDAAIKERAETAAINARSHDMMMIYINSSFTIVMILVTIWNARNITNTISKPIARLRAALQEVAKGDFRRKISDIMRNDTFGDIAKDIDAVSARAVRALDEQEAQRELGENVIERLREGLKCLSAGDLSQPIQTEFDGNYEALRINYNETVDRLNMLVADVVTCCSTLQGQSETISSDSSDLSQRTESQAATLEQTAAALEVLTNSVTSAAQNAKDVEQAVAVAKTDVQRSEKVVESAISAMTAIEDSSGKISKIITVIDDIAFQTNLLALNARVEAARAGEVGRGFAVVASEVGSLAQRSSDAANEIKELITESTTHVQDGVNKVHGAGEALSGVIEHVNEIATLMVGISTEASEQAQGLTEINLGIGQLDQVTQQNALMVESSGRSILAMNSETTDLNRVVGQFVLKGSGNDTEVWDTEVANTDEEFDQPEVFDQEGAADAQDMQVERSA